MSQYHKHCGTSSTPAKKPDRIKKPKAIPKKIPKPIEPESKPTNLLALLTTKVSDQTEIPKESKPATSRQLDIINLERDCSCGIVARGIRDHIHMNIGMTGRRDKIKEQIDLCDKYCEKQAKCKNTKPEYKSLVTKDNTAEDTTSLEKCPICEAMSDNT